MDRILKYITEHRFYRGTIAFLKGLKFTRERVSLYLILKILFRKVSEDELIERANGVAFSFTLALFPAIIFLFTLIPYITVIPDLREQIMAIFQEWMPPYMYDAASATIYDILSQPRGGLLSLGFFFAIYLSTNGMLALMKSFNKIYKAVEKRSYFKTHLISIMLTFMLALVLVFAVVLLFIGEYAIHMIEEAGFLTDSFSYYGLYTVRFLIMYVVFQLAVSMIYYFAPAVRYKWHFFSTGAVLATLASLGISYAFSYYIANFGTYNKLYGSIGALIALMIWLFLLSIIMLLGYELNAAVDQAKERVKTFERFSEKQLHSPIRV